MFGTMVRFQVAYSVALLFDRPRNLPFNLREGDLCLFPDVPIERPEADTFLKGPIGAF